MRVIHPRNASLFPEHTSNPCRSTLPSHMTARGVSPLFHAGCVYRLDDFCCQGCRGIEVKVNWLRRERHPESTSEMNLNALGCDLSAPRPTPATHKSAGVRPSTVQAAISMTFIVKITRRRRRRIPHEGKEGTTPSQARD